MGTKEKYIYNIYWTDCFGTKDFVATTYDVDKWLEQNNKERIAQMVITKHEKAKWTEVKFLENTERGVGGFGSTGVK